MLYSYSYHYLLHIKQPNTRKTKKISPLPIVLIGSDFWNPLLTWFEKELLKKNKVISKEDLDLYKVFDSIEEAYKYILKNVDCNKDYRQL